MTASESPVSPGTKRKFLRPAILAAGVVALLVIAHVLGLAERLGELRVWIESLGAWGPLVFIGIYAVAVVAAIPGSAITILAGALFGSLLGVVLVSVAATFGATLAFLISRYFARETVTHWLSRSEMFSRLDAMTERHGAVIVAITRLVPLFPFNLLNYGFGLTRVRLGTYVFWSWLCMLPGTVLYVVGSDAVFTALAESKVPWGHVAVAAAAIVLIAVLTILVRKYMKAKNMEAGG